MTPSTPTRTVPGLADLLAGSSPRVLPGLALLHLDGDDRAGEVALVPPGGGVLGREGDLLFGRQLPDEQPIRGRPLQHPSLSRRAVEVRPEGDGLRVRAVGRNALKVRGVLCEEDVLAPGDALELVGVLSALCVRRPEVLEELDVAIPVLGRPDAWGMVGESPTMWALRDRVYRVAPRRVHVLVHGPTGAGKEAVARGLHQASGRKGPFVSRSAATLPETLVDAELFGNVANFPNPGMPERPGLVGAADGGTLFLDEIAELPEALQAHLLRVLDEGEYQRLGETRIRRADLRVVGATNRPLEMLRPELVHRFSARVTVPGLDERREDVPLIAACLLRRMARDDPEGAGRFVEPDGRPRWTPGLAAWLAERKWSGHVRELEQVLWGLVDEARGDRLDVPRGDRPPEAARLTAERIRAELERHGGNRERTWRALGLSSRHQLYRLMRRYGIK